MNIFKRKVKKTVLVCCGTGCLANNSFEIYKGLKKKIEDLAVNVKVRPVVKATGCNGLCEKGPIVTILPDDVFYCGVKVTDVDEIVENTVLNNKVIERLLYFDSAKGQLVL